jgi:TonB family protein
MFSGLMLTQYTQGMLVCEDRILSAPASIGSIPAAADQEDFVSMAFTAALKTRQILDNSWYVIAIELMAGAQEKGPAPSAPASDSLLALINQIGSLDLTGEQERKRQEEIEKMRQDLIAQGKISHAEMRELERVQALKENPQRRPSAIRKDINENVSQLKYLYNKRLRAGAKMAGRVDMEFHIRPDGKVAGARVVRSTINDPAFEKEIAAQIMTWTFPQVVDSLGDMTVNYPFEFSEEE